MYEFAETCEKLLLILKKQHICDFSSISITAGKICFIIVILIKCILNYSMQGDYGDVSDRKDLRNRLGCKSFGWYLKTMLPDMKLPETALYSGEVGVLYLRN